MSGQPICVVLDLVVPEGMDPERVREFIQAVGDQVEAIGPGHNVASELRNGNGELIAKDVLWCVGSQTA